MPRFTKDDQVIETSNVIEGARLRAAGFTESKARTAGVRERDAAQGATDADQGAADADQGAADADQGAADAGGAAAAEKPASKPASSSRGARGKK